MASCWVSSPAGSCRSSPSPACRSACGRPDAGRLAPLYGHCTCDVVPFVTNAGIHWPAGFETKKPGIIKIRFLSLIPTDRDPKVVADDLEKPLNSEKEELLRKTSRACFSEPNATKNRTSNFRSRAKDRFQIQDQVAQPTLHEFTPRRGVCRHA